MRRIIRALVLSAVAGVMLVGCGGKQKQVEDSAAVELVPLVIEEIKAPEEDRVSIDDVKEYRGSLIAQYGNIELFANYGLPDKDRKYGDDVGSKDETRLDRYVDGAIKDSAILVGEYMKLVSEGKLCKIVVGVDTVSVDITKPLKRTINLRYADALPGCRKYRLSKHYTLNYRSSPTDFQINLALPDNAPKFILNFINESIRDDVAGIFCVYSGDDIVYPEIPLFKISNYNIRQMMQYYYKQFCKLYFKEECGDEESIAEAMGSHYSNQMYIYPVWKSADGKLTTWKFYEYRYLGGAHGGESEYFLTFDNRTGRILGVKDFFTDEEFKQAVSLLAKQLNTYHGDGRNFSADIKMDSNVTDAESTTLNEVIGGKLYPRPAMTRQGIVFSYQTYEKGSNGDGILHFTQPWKKVRGEK